MNRDIRMQVEGALLEKLLQRVLSDGAEFARITRPSPRRMIVEGDRHSCARLQALCKTYGYGCRPVYRGGWTAARDLLLRRWTILPGLLLGAVLCALCLGRVWMVDVQFIGPNAFLGNRTEILACLQENGIHAGISRSRIDADLLQKQLLARIPSASHAGVRLQGIRLLAEISPESPEPEVYEISHARDLVAMHSGVIESIDVYSGQACVKPGDTVLRGEILIRGEEIAGKNTGDGEEITVPVAARGRVQARYWLEGWAEGPLFIPERIRTGNRQTSSRISLMSLSLPLAECEGYPSEDITAESRRIVGLFLPLRLERITHWETIEKRIPVSRPALEKKLSSLARADALRKTGIAANEYEIRSGWTEPIETETTLRIRAVYEISADIAAVRDALIEEVY